MMELQLGLALPTHTTFFDLNKIGSYGVEEMADFDGTYEEGDSGVAGKIEDESSSTRTLSLLVWPGQPNEEDDRCPRKVPCSLTNKKGEEEEDQVIVGWPPIKTWRKKIVSQQQQVEAVMNVGANGEGGHPGQNMVSNGNSVGRSNFVKVKMQGVAIARKIDGRWSRMLYAYLSRHGKGLDARKGRSMADVYQYSAQAGDSKEFWFWDYSWFINDHIRFHAPSINGRP